jgi:hypothetical protein
MGRKKMFGPKRDVLKVEDDCIMKNVCRISMFNCLLVVVNDNAVLLFVFSVESVLFDRYYGMRLEVLTAVSMKICDAFYSG